MGNIIQTNQLETVFQEVSALFENKRDFLCEMDAMMGDGDLGITMSKGFHALPDLLHAEASLKDDIGMVLMKSGMKMASIVPSTMGTLMASGLMEAGKALKGHTGMDSEGLVLFYQAFAQGIAKRGKCQVGDRTVLDAISGAADFAKQACENGASLEEVAAAAAKGAEEATEKTKNMLPKYGKAAVHAAKAIGVADQGATAGMFLMEGICTGISKLA